MNDGILSTGTELWKFVKSGQAADGIHTSVRLKRRSGADNRLLVGSFPLAPFENGLILTDAPSKKKLMGLALVVLINETGSVDCVLVSGHLFSIYKLFPRRVRIGLGEFFRNISSFLTNFKKAKVTRVKFPYLRSLRRFLRTSVPLSRKQF